jgi:uncharacterized OB-fold protein
VSGPPTARSAHPAVRVAEGEEPWLEGFRCETCAAVMIEQPLACRACGSRTPPGPFRASGRGRIVTWSTVLRSFPGVVTPFVSAIVDLDDGLALKGTLRGIAPEAVTPGLRIAVRFDDAGGARDAEGAPYVGFHFVPEGDAA